MRRKLLFFVTEDWYFVSHRLPLAVAAQEAGYDVSVVTRVREHGEIIRAAGIRLIPFENSRGGLNPLVEISTLVRLVRLFRCERPDIAHHVALKPVLYGSIAARIARTPRVVNALCGMGWLFTSKSGLALFLNRIARWTLRLVLRSGVVLVQNPDDFQLLLDLGVPAGKIHRIAGSGVNLRQFFPTPEPEDVPTIVLPARLLWAKGVGELVGAARLLKQRGVKARVLLAGMPDPANRSSVPPEEIAKWVEEGLVEHAGWVADMPSLLARTHIVCLPSYYREGIPKSLIEAAAAGRPIVAADVPGCREIVREGENGLLVPARSIEALADALTHLIENPELRKRMGVCGRSRAEREFGLEMVITQILQLYSEATALREPASGQSVEAPISPTTTGSEAAT
jgi:glycosyltransferase involved in cell wall biosynthesis